MAAPTPREALDILRQRFGGFDPLSTEADDPNAPVALHALRATRADELSDQLVNDEAAALIPREGGYVPGEPGRRAGRTASDVAGAALTRKRFERVKGEMAADPFTGQVEQDRVQGIRDALTDAATTQRPEIADAANAVASRNAFATFMKTRGAALGGFEAAESPVGQAALDAASKRKTAEAGALGSRYGMGLYQVPDPENPGTNKYVTRGQAVGSSAPNTMQQREKIQSYSSLLKMADNILALGDETGWSGIGPISGPAHDFWFGLTGQGDPKGDQLRSMLSELTAESAFARGGKNLTGTEREMIGAFLADVKHNPARAKLRLNQFMESGFRNLEGMGVNLGGGDDETGGR